MIVLASLKKSSVITLSNEEQNFVWVYIAILITAIYLLRKHKFANLRVSLQFNTLSFSLGSGSINFSKK